MGVTPETTRMVGKPSNDWMGIIFEKILSKHGFDNDMINNKHGKITKECIFAVFNKYAATDTEWLAEYVYELMNGYLYMCNSYEQGTCSIPDFSYLPSRRPDVVYIHWC